MLTKSKIVLSAAILIGTAALGLAKQHPPLMQPIYAEPNIPRRVPANETSDIRLRSGEEAFAFHQGFRIFFPVPPLR
jgi:hypothetical protein